MLDQPDAPEQITQPRKLVLPAYPDEQRQNTTIRPEQLIRGKSSLPPGGPMTKLNYFWRKDPAYKVLIIAITAVVISGIIFSIFGSLALLQNSNATPDSSSPQNPAPGSTVVLNPTFPAPNATSASTASSQPPKHTTPTVTPDVPSGQPTPSQNGSLAVQITNIPNPVANNSVVIVDVSTNQLFASVQLQVRYSSPPFYYTSPSRPTDGSGSASIPWRIHVRGNGIGQTTAIVVAVVTDQNGQQSSSAQMLVQIITD